MLSLGHMTKACALIGPFRGVLKKTLPGVGSFLESVSAQFEASEAFFILVTLHEKAKQKSSRGGGQIFGFFYIVYWHARRCCNWSLVRGLTIPG